MSQLRPRAGATTPHCWNGGYKVRTGAIYPGHDCMYHLALLLTAYPPPFFAWAACTRLWGLSPTALAPMWYLLHPATPGSVTRPPRTYLGGPSAAPVSVGRKSSTICPEGSSVSRRHATVTVAPAVSERADDGGRGNGDGGRPPPRPTVVSLHDTSAHGTWVMSAAAVAAAATAPSTTAAVARKAPTGIASPLAEGDRVSFGASLAGAYTLCWEPLLVAIGVDDAPLSTTIRAHAAAAGFATLSATAAAGVAAAAVRARGATPNPAFRRVHAFPATAVWGAPCRPVTGLLRAAAAGATPVTPAWTSALVDAVVSVAGVLPAPRLYAPAVVGLPGVVGGAPSAHRPAVGSSSSEATSGGGGGRGGGSGGFPPPLAGLLAGVRVVFERADTGTDWAPVVAAASGAVVSAGGGGGGGSGAGRLLLVTGPPEEASVTAAAAARPPPTASGDERVVGRVGLADLAAALLRGDTAPLFGVVPAAPPEGGVSPPAAAAEGRPVKRARVGGVGGRAGEPVAAAAATAAPPRAVANPRARAMAMLGFDSSSDEDAGEARGAEGGEGGGRGGEGDGAPPIAPVGAPIPATATAAAAAAATLAATPAAGVMALDVDGGPAGGTASDGGGDAAAMDMSPPGGLGDGAAGADVGVDADDRADAAGDAGADAWADADASGSGSDGSSADSERPPDSPVAPGFVPAAAATRRRHHLRRRRRRGGVTTSAAAIDDEDGDVNPVVVAPLLTAGGGGRTPPLPPPLRTHPRSATRGGVDVRVFAARPRAAPRLISLVAVRGGVADGGAGGGGM